MNLTVKLFAHFAKLLPPGSEKQSMNVDIHDGANIGELLDQCSVPREDFRLVMINGITHTNPPVTLQIRLKDGDTVAVLPKLH